MRVFILFLFLLPAVLSGQVTPTKFFIEGKYPGVVYKPSTWSATKKYPVVIFLHGESEKGTGTDASLNLLVNSTNQANLLLNAEKYGFIVVAPQLVTSFQADQPGWTQGYMRRYFEYALKTFNVDTNYFHVTGLSRGGGGVWTAICDPIWSKKIASAVPICGTPEYANDFLQPAINGVAVWAFHAKNDATIGVIASQNQVRYINEKSPVIPAKLTLYETGGHYIWGTVYGTDSVYKWMLSYKKSSTPPIIVTPPPSTKKVKYRIIVYEDGSIEVIPEGTGSVPAPQPPGAPIFTKLDIKPADVYDGTQARKTTELLFDGDTTTMAFQDYYNGYIIEQAGGQIVWVDLGQYINNGRIELFNGRWAYGGQVDFQLYYSETDTVRKSPVFSTTLPSLEWKSLDIPWNDSARLLKIRIADGGSNNFSEVKVYANKLAQAPAFLPAPIAGPPDEGKYFMGYNKLSVDTSYDDAGWSQRNINDMNYIHPNINETDGKKIYINRYASSIELTYLPAKRNGRKSHFTGAAVREGFKYPPNFTNDSKDMPRGADSTKPEAWQAVKNTYYGLAAKMGHNKNAFLDSYVFINTPPGAGLNVTDAIEVGNEDDARWAGPLRFHAAVVKMQKLLAAYYGIKAADSLMQVISGAITGIDTAYLKAMYIVGRFMGLKQYPFDILAINEYCTNAGGQHSGTSDGVSPEEFKLYEKLKGSVRARDRYYPGKPIYLTEIGYDVHDGSNYDVPVIAGQTREQTKAMWGLRCFEISAADSISRVYWYTQEQSGGMDFGTTGFVKPIKKPDGIWTSEPVDLYWYVTCRNKTLENYKAWPAVLANGGTTGVWILKYRHLTDLKKYVISFWIGTSNNSVINNYAINVGAVAATLVTPTVGIKQGNRQGINIVNGTVWATATECPQYIEITI